MASALERKASEMQSCHHLEELKADVEADDKLAQECLPVDDSPCNPRNWPAWKRNTQIILASVHCMLAAFQVAGIVPAYSVLAKLYGRTTPQASYFVSTQILMLGVAPAFWNALMIKYGRYHAQLASAVGSMVFVIAGARCTTYGAQLATRIITAAFASAPLGNGAGIIADLCAFEHRGRMMGVFVVAHLLGTPMGPFVMGFVAQHLDWPWIFWIFAMLNAALVAAYLLFGAETRYHQSQNTTPVPDRSSLRLFLASLVPRSNSPRPFRALDIVSPLALARKPRIAVPAFVGALVFCYGHIALMAEMPIWMEQKFNFGPQQIGLQSISVIVGTIIGEAFAGHLSDRLINMLSKWRGRKSPNDRLWLSYAGFGLLFPGLMIWGVLLQRAEAWNIWPLVGIAIATVANQMQMTILITFSVDCHRESAESIGVFYNFVRLVYGFIGPFYMPYMFRALGLAGAAGVFCGILAGAGFIPLVILHLSYRNHQVVKNES